MTHDTVATSPTAFGTGGEYSRFIALDALDADFFTEAELDAGLDALLINPLDNMGAS